MSARDAIVARLGKLKALAARGVGGERAAAESLVEAIAGKYGIDLDGLDVEDEGEFPMPITGWKLSLFAQLAGLMRLEQYGGIDVDHCQVKIRLRRALVSGRAAVKRDPVFCGSKSQFVELKAKFDILSRDYETQRRALYRAFLTSNGLLLPFGSTGGKVTEKELAEARVADRLAGGIVPSAIRKMIEGPEADDEE